MTDREFLDDSRQVLRRADPPEMPDEIVDTPPLLGRPRSAQAQ